VAEWFSKRRTAYGPDEDEDIEVEDEELTEEVELLESEDNDEEEEDELLTEEVEEDELLREDDEDWVASIGMIGVSLIGVVLSKMLS